MPVAELPPGMARGQEVSPPIERPFQLQTRTLEVKYQETIDFAELDVLGHYPDDSIEVYSRSARKVQRIKDIGYWNFTHLVYTLGPASQRFHGGREAISSMRTLDQLKEAIAYFGGRVSLIDKAPIGEGVWWAGDQIVLVNGGRAAVFDPATCKLATQDVPRVAGQILDFSSNEEWIDFAALQADLDRAAAAVGWRDGVLNEVAGLLEKWFWKSPVDHLVTAGLVAASFIQTLWPWRPEVTLTGASDSGKTTMIHGVLAPLFGDLGLYCDHPTEAGVRQILKNRAKVVIIDEFENAATRRRFLDISRSSSQGTQIIRGTSDQRGTRYAWRHLLWMASIESGLIEQADRNRFIVLELLPPPPDKRGALKLPPAAAIKKLGREFLAAILAAVGRAMKLADELKCCRVEGAPGRVVENYAVPAAALAAIRGLDDDGARALLVDLMRGKDLAAQGGSDSDDLMTDLLSARIDGGQGRHCNVAEVLSSQAAWEEFHKPLQRHGMAVVQTESRGRRGAAYHLDESTRLFIAPKIVRSKCLRFTRFQDLDLNQLVSRLPGAEPARIRLLGHICAGYKVPIQSWVERDHATNAANAVVDAADRAIQLAPEDQYYSDLSSNGHINPGSVSGQIGSEGDPYDV
jgi:hypothetical protein